MSPASMAPKPLHLQETARGVLLRVKVVPGASRTRICGTLGGALKAAVAAPPERGKANEALVKLLAKALGLPASDIFVEQGHSSPHKTVRIHGLAAQEISLRLGFSD